MGKPKLSSLGAAKHRSNKDKDLTKIRELEQLIDESRANWNYIVDIAAYYSDVHSHRIVYTAIHALQRIFQQLFETNEFDQPILKSITAEKCTDSVTTAKVVLWLHKVYQNYIQRLLRLLQHPEPGLQVSSLKILLTFLPIESKQLHKKDPLHTFANAFYIQILERAFINEHWNSVLANAWVEHINLFDDLRFYMYRNLTHLIDKEIRSSTNNSTLTPTKKRKANTVEEPVQHQQLQLLSESCFSVIEGVTKFPKKSSDLNRFLVNLSQTKCKQELKLNDTDLVEPPLCLVLNIAAHRRAFSKFIVMYLRQPTLTMALYKKILLVMNKQILPNMIDPKLLMSFLTASYNLGSSISLLALHSVFTMIQHHNLDYPDFYGKLYTLLDCDLMHVKYRSRFFRLLDMFLQSTHIPAYLVAAFIKRIARLCLYAPPGAILLAIPFIYNLLQRHPQCLVMIHRDEDNSDKSITTQDGDPFNSMGTDPAHCQALESSLWELQSLKSHYFANIATLAKIFENKFTKESYDLNDFCDHTYTTLFESSAVKVVNKQPAMNYDIPSTLFTADDITAELFDV